MLGSKLNHVCKRAPGGNCLIHDTKYHKDTQLQSLNFPVEYQVQPSNGQQRNIVEKIS